MVSTSGSPASRGTPSPRAQATPSLELTLSPPSVAPLGRLAVRMSTDAGGRAGEAVAPGAGGSSQASSCASLSLDYGDMHAQSVFLPPGQEMEAMASLSSPRQATRSAPDEHEPPHDVLSTRRHQTVMLVKVSRIG